MISTEDLSLLVIVVRSALLSIIHDNPNWFDVHVLKVFTGFAQGFLSDKIPADDQYDLIDQWRQYGCVCYRHEGRRIEQYNIVLGCEFFNQCFHSERSQQLGWI